MSAVDPFAPAESAPQADVAAEIAAESVAEDAPAADIPVVDREGAPVEAQEGAFNPVNQTMTPPPAEAAQEPASAPEAPQEAPAPAAEPQEAAQAPVAATPDPAPAPAEPVSAPGPDAAAATPTPETQTQTAPPKNPPAEAGTKKGEVRHYKVLLLTGPMQWTEIDLSTKGDMEGVTVVKVAETGDELWFEARNNEHANKLAYYIVGAPSDGARLWAVPKGSFKPKTIKPAAPRPERQRLDIS